MIRLAQEEDHDTIVKLLKRAQLDEEGVDKPTTRFFLAEKRSDSGELGEIVGTVGIELIGERALLRSLVLNGGTENARIGLEMIRVMLAFVQQHHIKEIYLTTAVPSAFFNRLGFTEISWEALPPEIRASEHIQKTNQKGIHMVHSETATKRS